VWGEASHLDANQEIRIDHPTQIKCLDGMDVIAISLSWDQTIVHTSDGTVLGLTKPAPFGCVVLHSRCDTFADRDRVVSYRRIVT